MFAKKVSSLIKDVAVGVAPSWVERGGNFAFHLAGEVSACR